MALVGKTISNYKVVKFLGEGGMSTVYLGVHKNIDRKVAIKVLKPDLLKSHKIRKRFKNEAATLSKFNHPNIVTLYDYIEYQDRLHIIMEYVEGVTLDEYINTVTGPIPEEKLKPLFTQILQGVEYAHQHKIIHRDIKPSNFIITKDGQVKILDFGIAKILDDENLQLTKEGSKIGTILYMSPEQVKGEKVDEKSDIYSLGVLLFHMASGKCPYNVKSSEYEVYDKIVKEPLPNARKFYFGISNQIHAIITKATQKNPLQRFRDIREFSNSISRLTDSSIPGSYDEEVDISMDFLKTQVANSGKRLLASLIDWLYPLIYFLFYFFTRDVNYQAYSFFKSLIWTMEDKHADINFFYSGLVDSFFVSFINNLGPFKLVLSYLLFAYIVIQIIFLSIKGQTLGKHFLGLVIVRLPDYKNGGFVTNFLMRKIVNIGLILLFSVFGIIGLYQVSIVIVVVLSLYYIVDKLFIFKGRCLHDLIARTKVINF